MKEYSNYSQMSVIARRTLYLSYESISDEESKTVAWSLKFVFPQLETLRQETDSNSFLWELFK